MIKNNLNVAAGRSEIFDGGFWLIGHIFPNPR